MNKTISEKKAFLEEIIPLGIPSIDYDDESDKVMKWQDTAETVKHISSIDLKPHADSIRGTEPLIRFFLDGSRHVFKVDDIAYNNASIFLQLLKDVAVIRIESADPSKDISMREVYGLDPEKVR